MPAEDDGTQDLTLMKQLIMGLPYRVNTIARVESEEDIPFWQHAFSQSRPDLKVKYLPSENGEGTDVRQ